MNFTLLQPRWRPAILVALLGAVSKSAWALTVDQTVTPGYVREHARELSVTVKKGGGGLISFTIVRTLPERRYLVARLVVRHKGRILAESSTPSYSKKDENLFYFSLAPDRLADTQFELSESWLRGDPDHPVPQPGTVNYQFRLREFVPDALLATPAAG